MVDVYPKILAADTIILATPVYFEMLSGLLKNFMDRTCPIWTKLESKRIAGLAVAEFGIGQTINNFKSYASVCSLEWIGGVTALAKTPGEVAKDKYISRKLSRLAQKPPFGEWTLLAG